MKSAVLIAFILLLSCCMGVETGTRNLSNGGGPLACPEGQIPHMGCCCFDLDADGTCDKEDKPKAKSTSTTTQTTLTSIIHTTSSTSSTLFHVACRSNSDCGIERVERVCFRSDVYLKRLTPSCRMPGTIRAFCVEKSTLVGQSLVSKPSPVQVCVSGCVNGTCI